MLWGFRILFGGTGILIGFVKFEEKAEKALKELVRQDSRVAEILKNVGLL